MPMRHVQTYKENYSWNPTTCNCENGKHLGIIIYDSVITYDEIINLTDNVSTTFQLSISYKMGCYMLHTRFFSDHTTIYNRYYLVSLCKA